MSCDCIIIGGGIAGLVCGIKCAGAGLRVSLFSAGMSALHFSSGSIDVLGRDAAGEVVGAPFEAMAPFLHDHPRHPYAKCGREGVAEALSFFREEVAKESFSLYANGRRNHQHVTALGTLKPTFFSQQSVFNRKLKEKYGQNPRIAILTFEGFRDFYPGLAEANLKKNPIFQDCEILTGAVDMAGIAREGQNPYDFRSMDLARCFDALTDLDEIAHRINAISGSADIIGLPAVMGIRNHNVVYEALQARVKGLLYEVPTLPPSILGMRLDNALKSRFAALGGVFIAGDRVTGGEVIDGVLQNIQTRNQGDRQQKAPFFVLATGSFFSGGLVSDAREMREPVFGLSLEYTRGRSSWHAQSFFELKSHPFLGFGVKTNEKLNPRDALGREIKNLFCAGAVLSHYNPVSEASGGGVAVSTGYMAAKRIIAHLEIDRDEKRFP